MTPTYNYPNEKKRIFCVSHKLDGMVSSCIISLDPRCKVSHLEYLCIVGCRTDILYHDAKNCHPPPSLSADLVGMLAKEIEELQENATTPKVSKSSSDSLP